MNLKEIINGLFKNSQNYKTKNEEVCDLSGFNQVKINNAIRNFFPETGVWYSNCYLKPTALNIDNLPCHLRDYNWMAQMLQKKAELDNVDIDVLEGYITNSALFNSLKDKYEKKIVKWQINYMISGGTNWRDDSEYGTDFSAMEDKCVEQFRKGVFHTLITIGIDPQVIDMCLQEYQDMWFSKMLNQSFDNLFEYTHTFPTVEGDSINLNTYDMHKSDPEFRKAWIKLKRYEYYIDNKDVVDLFEDMKDVAFLSVDEVKKLREYVEFKSYSRRHAISAFKSYMYECDKSIIHGNGNPLGNMYVDKKDELSLQLK